MNKCKVCGGEYAPGETICPYCGHSLLEDEKVNSNTSSISTEKSKDTSVLKYSEFMDTEALYQFGLCKLDGVGTDKNEQEAFDIFQKLAFRGHFDSMYKLAEMLLAQEEPDYETAYMWLKIAADGGHEQSRIRLKVLSSKFSPYVGQSKTAELPANTGVFESLVDNALHSVVLIKSIYKRSKKSSIINNGAGFIIEGGYVITNAHVVGDAPECVTACFESKIDDKDYVLLPLVVRKDFDIAVLKFTGLMADKIEAKDNLTLRATLPFYGEEVYTVGNPLGIGFSVSKGIVSCPDRVLGQKYPQGVDSVIQVDITVNHGNSGGALLDSQNNVLGMVTFIPGNSAGGITMCVPSKYIVEVLNSLS